MKIIKRKYLVQGMSCTGCEAIIEKTLKKMDGIKEVKASFSKNTIDISYDSDIIKFSKMKAEITKAGYTLEKMPKKTTEPEVASKDKTFTTLQFIGIAVALLLLYLLISNTVGFNFIPEVTHSMGYGILFVVGLLTSLHCVAMCGGINISQCMKAGNPSRDPKANIVPSLAYNLGRVTSYTVIGGIIGVIGSVISFSGWARGLIAILSGVFMVIMGLSMTGLFPWINKFTPRLPRIFRQKANSAGKGRGPFIVGLLNGLMPCGPLQAMQVYALGTGSFFAGALSMFFFSLGTLPLMFGLGAFITLLGNKFTRKMMKVSALLVSVLGIIMLGRGLILSGFNFPSFSLVNNNSASSQTTDVSENTAVSSASQSAATSETGTNGDVQNITTAMTSTRYPNITVKKGVPVVWDFQADSKYLNGCNSKMSLYDFDTDVSLKPGDNIIKFTPTQSGTYTYSCWMGMVTGGITVTD